MTTAVCFVCTGNICRSPMAAAVLRQLATDTVLADGTTLASQLEVSSAGTSGWHDGDAMDPRARDVLAAHGYADDGHVAVKVDGSRLDRLDLVVSLARQHDQTLRGIARRHGVGEERFVLLRSFDPSAGGSLDVPDPYYGDDEDFVTCFRIVEAGCRGLTAALAERVGAGRP